MYKIIDIDHNEHSYDTLEKAIDNASNLAGYCAFQEYGKEYDPDKIYIKYFCPNFHFYYENPEGDLFLCRIWKDE